MVICHDTTRKKSPEKQNIQVFFRPSFDNSHLQPARWYPEKKSCGLSGISTHSSPLTWIYSRYNWTNFHMFVGDLPPFKLVLLDQRKTNFHFIWGWLSKYFYFKTSFSFNSPILLWIHVGLIFSCLDGMGWDRDHPRVFLKVGPIGRVRLCDANPLGTTLNIPNISMSLGIILICSPDLYHWHLDVSWYALIASHGPKKWTPRGQSSH